MYTEWVLKRSSSSLHWQNMQLYSWGVVVNAAGLAWADMRGGLPPGAWMRSFLQGYNAWAYGAILNLALSGLLVAWIMMWADMGSLLKVVTDCASVAPSCPCCVRTLGDRLLACWLLEPANTAVQVFATSCAMLLTAAATSVLMQQQIHLQLVLGMTIMSVAAALFYADPGTLTGVNKASSICMQLLLHTVKTAPGN